MKTPLSALEEHKPLLLAVARTISDRERDADWATVREWVVSRDFVC